MKTYIKWLLVAAVISAGLSVSACAPVAIAEAEAVTVMGSDKTIVDHLVSLGSGKDCSTLRKERGLTYCVEDMPQIRQNIYCYRNLAGVTCYDRADPHGSGQKQQRVGLNDHNLPK